MIKNLNIQHHVHLKKKVSDEVFTMKLIRLNYHFALQ